MPGLPTAAVGSTILLVVSPVGVSACQAVDFDNDNDNHNDNNDDDVVGGVVTGPNGREAGLWVKAETTDLPTKFAKIVVTDDLVLR